MADEKHERRLCPNCGNALARDVPPERIAWSLVVAHTLFLVALAFLIACLLAPRGDGEIYAALGLAALWGWFLLRRRERMRMAESLHYVCANCHGRFVGEDLQPEKRRASPGFD